MPIEMAIWRMTEAGPRALTFSRLDIEKRLEDMIIGDPGLIGTDLLVIGRQVPTGFGGFIDLLALDIEGRLHILELKRDRTPRDVVAQTLDYGSWARFLTLDAIADIFEERTISDKTLADAFAEHFAQPLPDVVNADQQLTIVASELDPASDRIVGYLAEHYGVPVNAVFFRHFVDDGSEYLARTWLLTAEETAGARARSSSAKVRPWNGNDYYVILGNTQQGTDRWDIARTYNYLNGGGSSWYWKPLRNLQPGNRVFAYVGGAGYVGVGLVTGTAISAADATVTVDGREETLLSRREVPEWFRDDALSPDEDITELVVPVDWLRASTLDAAISEPGLFASQVTVCRLRDERTIQTVERRLGIGADAPSEA